MWVDCKWLEAMDEYCRNLCIVGRMNKGLLLLHTNMNKWILIWVWMNECKCLSTNENEWVNKRRNEKVTKKTVPPLFRVLCYHCGLLISPSINIGNGRLRWKGDWWFQHRGFPSQAAVWQEEEGGNSSGSRAKNDADDANPGRVRLFLSNFIYRNVSVCFLTVQWCQEGCRWDVDHRDNLRALQDQVEWGARWVVATMVSFLKVCLIKILFDYPSEEKKMVL